MPTILTGVYCRCFPTVCVCSIGLFLLITIQYNNVNHMVTNATENNNKNNNNNNNNNNKHKDSKTIINS